MSKSFLELTKDLAEAETSELKIEISEQIGRSIEEDEKHTERLMHSFFTSSLARVVGNGFQEIVRSDFFSTRVRAYFDEDFSTKIAIGISYLQSHNEFIPDLDSQVLDAVVNEISRRNLNILVNDISVNALQMRNGARVNSTNT